VSGLLAVAALQRVVALVAVAVVDNTAVERVAVAFAHLAVVVEVAVGAIIVDIALEETERFAMSVC
jgi:hypothetical protein